MVIFGHNIMSSLVYSIFKGDFFIKIKDFKEDSHRSRIDPFNIGFEPVKFQKNTRSDFEKKF